MAILLMNKCKEIDCLNQKHSLGWCIKHYKNYYRHGSPHSTFIRTKNGSSIKEKLLSKSILNPATNCLEWIGAVNKQGYGKLTINKKSYAVHILSFEIHNKPIEKNGWVLHHCDNPKCINPDHLFLGSRQDNIKDMVQKNRQYQGEHHHKSRLNVKDIQNIFLLKNEGKKNVEIGKLFDIKLSHLNSILNRKIWKTVEIPL